MQRLLCNELSYRVIIWIYCTRVNHARVTNIELPYKSYQAGYHTITYDKNMAALTVQKYTRATRQGYLTRSTTEGSTIQRWVRRTTRQHHPAGVSVTHNPLIFSWEGPVTWHHQIFTMTRRALGLRGGGEWGRGGGGNSIVEGRGAWLP